MRRCFAVLVVAQAWLSRNDVDGAQGRTLGPCARSLLRRSAFRCQLCCCCALPPFSATGGTPLRLLELLLALRRTQATGKACQPRMGRLPVQP